MYICVCMSISSEKHAFAILYSAYAMPPMKINNTQIKNILYVHTQSIFTFLSLRI